MTQEEKRAFREALRKAYWAFGRTLVCSAGMVIHEFFSRMKEEWGEQIFSPDLQSHLYQVAKTTMEVISKEFATIEPFVLAGKVSVEWRVNAMYTAASAVVEDEIRGVLKEERPIVFYMDSIQEDMEHELMFREYWAEAWECVKNAFPRALARLEADPHFFLKDEVRRDREARERLEGDGVPRVVRYLAGEPYDEVYPEG